MPARGYYAPVSFQSVVRSANCISRRLRNSDWTRSPTTP